VRAVSKIPGAPSSTEARSIAARSSRSSPSTAEGRAETRACQRPHGTTEWEALKKKGSETYRYLPRHTAVSTGGELRPRF